MAKAKEHGWNWCCCSSTGWGIFFLVVGLFWLARELGWIASTISLWPIVFIALGAYMLFRSRKNTC